MKLYDHDRIESAILDERLCGLAAIAYAYDSNTNVATKEWLMTHYKMLSRKLYVRKHSPLEIVAVLHRMGVE